jgi:FHA domain-containing protein/zinc ribbon family protein
LSKYSTGTLAGAGSFSCATCGFHVALHALDEIPECPNCGRSEFGRASIFDAADSVGSSGLHDDDRPEWLTGVHDDLEDGQYLVHEAEEGVALLPLTREWTRIGRSLAADIRLDDPTVSRRHALLCRQEGDTRILDDRSLNGIFVNGERVEWADISDGDEVIVGRYRLFFVDNGQPAQDTDDESPRARPADRLVWAG